MLHNSYTVFFFFFKQKTAYEIRPCDWSSDVCSSDLELGEPDQEVADHARDRARGRVERVGEPVARRLEHTADGGLRAEGGGYPLYAVIGHPSKPRTAHDL